MIGLHHDGVMCCFSFSLVKRGGFQVLFLRTLVLLQESFLEPRAALMVPVFKLFTAEGEKFNCGKFGLLTLWTCSSDSKA